MKRIATIAIALAVLISITSTALAADSFLEGKISRVTIAKDKNGNEYTRITVEVPKVMSGVHYNAAMTVMAFAPHSEKAKTLKAGDAFKAVVSTRNFNGRESAVILGFVK